MRMKKLLLLSVLLGVCAVNLMAQDDLYFTPKKSEKAVKSTKNVMVDDNTPAYHVGTKGEVVWLVEYGIDGHIEYSCSSSLFAPQWFDAIRHQHWCAVWVASWFKLYVNI